MIPRPSLWPRGEAASPRNLGLPVQLDTVVYYWVSNEPKYALEISLSIESKPS